MKPKYLKKISPKVILLTALLPVSQGFATLREESKHSIDEHLIQNHVFSEEVQFNLACLLSCGGSCSHTNNC